jgi:hypothetical protein
MEVGNLASLEVMTEVFENGNGSGDEASASGGTFLGNESFNNNLN